MHVCVHTLSLLPAATSLVPSLSLSLSTLTRLFPTCVIMSCHFSDPLPDAAAAATERALPPPRFFLALPNVASASQRVFAGERANVVRARHIRALEVFSVSLSLSCAHSHTHARTHPRPRFMTLQVKREKSSRGVKEFSRLDLSLRS